jgi:ParB family chromosome partitioning protein
VDLDEFLANGGSNIEDVFEMGLAYQPEGGTVGPAKPGVQGEFVELPVDSIRPGPFQARRVFDEEALGELAESIREQGLEQPILVRPVAEGEGQYEIIAGERRWRAVRMLGQETILSRVRELSDLEAHLAAYAENRFRNDLSPWEKAGEIAGVQRTIEAAAGGPVTNRAIAQAIQEGEASVSRYLGIAKEIDAEMLRAAQVGEAEVCLLTVDALRRVLRLQHVTERTAALRAEVDKVRGIKVKGGKARSTIPSDPAQRWLHHFTQGGLQINIREPVAELSDEQTANYLQRTASAVTVLLAREANGNTPPPRRISDGQFGELLFVPPIHELDDAAYEAALEQLNLLRAEARAYKEQRAPRQRPSDG